MEIKGNITLLANGNSEIQNAVIERLAGTPVVLSIEKGRIIFNTIDNKYYYNDGSSYVSIATGGNAANLQTEVDAIETSIGASITAAGTFDATPFAGNTYTIGATSVTDAILKVAGAVLGHDTLVELTDVTVTAPANKQVLQTNGTGSWFNHTLVLGDVSDVTAAAAEVNQLTASGITTADLVKVHAVTASSTELNLLTGATLSTIELNYVDGVTSAIQTQLNAKQALDASLTSISGLNAGLNDLIFGTAVADVYALDSGAGARGRLGLVIGTDVQAFDGDLAQIAAFVPGSVSEDPAGQGARTVYDIMVGTGTVEGLRYTLQRGATARTSLGLGDIAVYDAAKFVKTDGTSTVIANIKFDGFKLTGLGAPTDAGDATNKSYVDSKVAGLSWKQAVKAATTVDVVLSGVQTVDTVVLVAGDRVLVKNQTNASQNGIYVVAAGAWVRADDFDQTSPIDEVNSAAVFVREGAINADQGFTQIASVVTIGTDAMTFTSFAGATSFVDGIGLKRTGNQVDVNLGAGIKELPSDEVGIDLYNAATGALILTTTGADRSTVTGAQLHLKTNLVQFDQDAGGLFMKAAGITAAELNGSVAGDGLVGGAGAALAVASHAGTSGSVGTITVTADGVGVDLGATSTTAAPGNHIHTASVVTFTPTGTVAATDVQAAIAEVSGDVTTLSGTATNLQTEVDAIELGAGLNADGTLTVFGGNYVTGNTSLRAATVTLDTALKTEETARLALATKVTNGYFLFSSVIAGTAHVVNHNMNCKYANVTVVDATDNVIIPQSIVYNTANQLTVTFNASIDCKVIVMGLNGQG